MASHPSILAWEILCTKEPVGPQSTGTQGSDKAGKQQQIHIKLHAYIIIISIILVKCVNSTPTSILYPCKRFSHSGNIQDEMCLTQI